MGQAKEASEPPRDDCGRAVRATGQRHRRPGPLPRREAAAAVWRAAVGIPLAPRPIQWTSKAVSSTLHVPVVPWRSPRASSCAYIPC
jgi:hypothetical protein